MPAVTNQKIACLPRALPQLLLVTITLAAWWGVVLGRFQYDDFTNIAGDPATSDITALVSRLTVGIRPLTRLSFFLDAQLFGMRPTGFLATNLALHVGMVVLAYALLRRHLRAGGALIAAAAFALQPAHAETVAYSSGRSTGLMALLLLAGLLLYQRARSWLAFVFFAAACFAKEVALVFPLLLLILPPSDADIGESTSPAASGAGRKAFFLRRLTPFLTALAIALALLGLHRYRTLAAYSLELRSPLANLLANGRAVPLMLSLWIRPWALSVDHDFGPNDHLAASIAGLAFLAALLVGAFALRRRAPLLSFAILWTLVCLAPTNSLLAKQDLVTEKPLYLAWLGPSLLLGRAADLVARRFRAPLTSIAAGIVLLIAGSWCVRRAAIWRDALALWEDATAKAPGSARCWNNLGMALFELKLDRKAAAAFREATRLDPTNRRAETNLRVAETICGPPCL